VIPYAVDMGLQSDPDSRRELLRKRLKIVSAVASLGDRCLCTMPSVENDGSEYDRGTVGVADAARDVAAFGSAIQGRSVYGCAERVKVTVEESVVVRSRK
jgi:hypothetical protein